MPPWACSKAPSRLSLAPREGPPLVAEQLALDERGGQGPAVDDNEGPAAARAHAVDQLGDHALAGAGLPLHQHGGLGAGQPGQHRHDVLDGGAGPQHARPQPAGLGAGAIHLGQEDLQDGVAELDRDLRLQIGALHPAATDLGAVEAAEVPQQQAPGGLLHDAVEAGDGRIGEPEVVAAGLADPDLFLVDEPARPAAGAGDHGQPVHPRGGLVALPIQVGAGGAIRLDVQTFTSRQARSYRHGRENSDRAKVFFPTIFRRTHQGIQGGCRRPPASGGGQPRATFSAKPADRRGFPRAAAARSACGPGSAAPAGSAA